MTVVTVPLDNTMVNMLDNLLNWESTNKADIFRNALRNYYESRTLQRIKQAEKEIKDGFGLKGNLDDLEKLV
jgi:metal-responsive CopG/Arc/MetJ family transcriptional regulator